MNSRKGRQNRGERGRSRGERTEEATGGKVALKRLVVVEPTGSKTSAQNKVVGSSIDGGQRRQAQIGEAEKGVACVVFACKHKGLWWRWAQKGRRRSLAMLLVVAGAGELEHRGSAW